MAAAGPWDVGHTEDSTEVEDLDYIDDSGEGAYEELLSVEEEQLARRGSVLDINAAFGRDPVLIGKISPRQESFVPVTKKRGEGGDDDFEEGQGLSYNIILFKDGYYDPNHCSKVIANYLQIRII